MTPPTTVESGILGLLAGLVIGICGTLFLTSVLDERAKQATRIEAAK